MNQMRRILVTMVLLVFANTLGASTINIGVATNKSTYNLGETVVVSVTAYNPNPQSVTLNFSSSLQATYLIDNLFNWARDKLFLQILTERTINPYDSYTWNLNHSSHEMTLYPLGIGNHTVVGEVVGYGLSSPIQFEVIPEPATIALLALGGLMFRKRK